MNKQNFNQSGGFPIKTQTLDEMQKAYNLFNEFGAIAGNFAIVSGCVVTGSVVSAGAVFIDGELLEFRGGQIGITVIIVEEAYEKEFKNGDAKNVLFIRYATFGAGTTSFPWANFKRPKNTIQLTEDKAEQTTIELLIDRIELLEARPSANVPIGFVGIWGLPLIAIPAGWTPHLPLKGRGAIGHDPDYDTNINGDKVNYNLNVLDYKSGVREHALKIAEMPRHRFKLDNPIPRSVADTDRGNNNSAFSLDTPVDGFTDYLGADEPHTNMHPYTVVPYIRYIGS